MKTSKWYAANTGNHQGLIIDEETGRNVAVVYDKKDAAAIAAAHDLLEALTVLVNHAQEKYPHFESPADNGIFAPPWKQSKKREENNQ